MRYCIFLRAINVGRHNRIRMDDLRARCEAAGLRNVVTHLQSGNVVCDAEGPGSEVASRLEAELVAAGLRNANAIVFAADELRALIALNPFAAYDPEQHRRLAILFRDPLPEGSKELFTGADGYEFVHLGERVLLTASPASAQMPGTTADAEKALKIPATARYWHVVEAVTNLA